MWIHVRTFAVGGLFNVGFVPDTEIVHILSSQAESMIDCKSAEFIYFDENGFDWYDHFDEETGMVSGVNEFSHLRYPTAGIHGEKSLPIQTVGIWNSLERASIDPKEPPNTTEYYLSAEGYDDVFIGTDGPCEFRCKGFSDSGRSFILASSCELVIFRQNIN